MSPRLRALAVDAGLLRRRRDFRLLTGAQFVSLLGSEFTRVALPFQVYTLTHSSLAVGAIGLAETVPIVGIALFSGAWADVADRRRLVVIAEIGGLGVAALLLANAALAHPMLWLLYVAAVLSAGFYALLRPPLDALVPQVVEADELTAAAGVEQVLGSIAFAGGPALAGVILAATDPVALYAVDLGSFAVSALLLARLQARPPAEERRASPLRDVAEGLRYARSRPELMGTYLVDMNAMIFGLPTALFPAIATRLGGPSALGALYAAPAVGAILVSAASGWAPHVRRQGRAIVLAAAGWGAAMVAFGFTDALWLALACLAVAGAMDAISGLFRATIWNQTIPANMRGRLAGIEMISYASGPGLGDLEAGAGAAVAGVRTSVVSGGVLCVLGSFALAAAMPALWRYEPLDQS